MGTVGKVFIHCLMIVACLCGSAASFAKPAESLSPDTQSDIEHERIELLERPLMERYVLDELRSIRREQDLIRVEVAEKTAQAQLSASDRAIRYTADTTNNIFYIITAAATLLVLLGVKSFSDIKENVESATKEQVAKLINDYEHRLQQVESNVKLRSDQLIAAQEEISHTNKVHSLWLRAGIEKNNEEKISIYDEILEIQPNDTEALTYKADVLLDMGEIKWAMSLTNEAMEQDSEYSFAYWQRACAHASLGNVDEAIADLERALELSPSFAEELESEMFFTSLREDERFKALLS